MVDIGRIWYQSLFQRLIEKTPETFNRTDWHWQVRRHPWQEQCGESQLKLQVVQVEVMRWGRPHLFSLILTINKIKTGISI